MRAALIEVFGSTGVSLCGVPRPTPSAGELLLRVRAASLNYRDLLVRSGSYNPRFKLPLILGSDAVGEVVELGEGSEAAGVRLGERVCPIFVPGWFDGPPSRAATRLTFGGPNPGVFAEYVVARADSVVRVPSYLDDVEAACLPCAAVTAWSALKTLSSLEQGQLLVTQGAGGVSLFALQIARAAGASVIATTRSAEKRDRLLALGADHVLDANAAGWGRSVRELTGGEGADHVLDVSGGASLRESLDAVRPGGNLSLVGVLAGTRSELDLLPVVMRNVRMQGVFVGHKRSFERLLACCEAERLHPCVDSVHEFERVDDAFARLASGRHFGKVCLRIAAT